MNKISCEGLRNDLVLLIKRLLQRCVKYYKSRSYYKQRARVHKATLRSYGLSDLGKYNNDTTNPKRILERLRQIDKFVAFKDNSVHDMYDLTGRFILKSLDTNESLYDELADEFQKIFIRDTNTLTKKLNEDREYCARIFFTGLIRGWTQRDYINFNKTV